MSAKKNNGVGIGSLLNGDKVRRVEQDGRTLYAAADVVALLTDAPNPAESWAELKHREPVLAEWVTPVRFPAGQAFMAADEVLDAVDVAGVARLVQSVPTPRAERVRAWLAGVARERVEEAENPELAFLRTRKLYEHKGYSRRWVDKRLRGVSNRQEVTGEWFKRGASDSEHFRALTNELMHEAFGMDVEGYRRHKGLSRTSQNLRDHMTDVELALTALAETLAVTLHRDRDSHGFDELLSDARDAGRIVANTRREIETKGGRSVVQPPAPAPAEAAA